MTMVFTTTAAPPAGVRVIGWLAAAGALPYLTIKLLWLTGHTTGVTEPAFLGDPAVVAGNAVTLTMDLLVIGLALALTHRWGDRLPGWLVLLPMWVATGFLVPMAVSVVPAVAVETLAGAPQPAGIEPWLQPVVYGGFAWQGVFLCAAFCAHAVRRWSGAVTVAGPVAAGPAPLVRVIVAGGCVMATASAVLHVGVGLAAGSAVTLGLQTADAALALAGAAGTVALVRRRGSRWAAVAAAWTGSAAMFSWGLYTVAVRMTADGFVTYDAAAGGAQLTGLLGGFALAVAGMLALVGTGEGPRG